MDEASEIPAIEFRHVSLSFGARLALEDISFTLRRGEMIFITGISASGKSVLLHLAIGLLKPDAGEIFVAGREIENLAEGELLKIRGGVMGIVFQEEALFTGLSVYDNVAFRLVEHHWSEEDTERAVREVLHFVGLEGDADKFPEELSGGMKRRVEIARALVGYPEVMLYDEPTEGLDPLTATQILDLIIRARDLYHISSLLVTKNVEDIPYLASRYAAKTETGELVIREATAPERAPQTRVILLHEGSIAFEGSAAEFASSPLHVVGRMTRAERDTPIPSAESS
jgi:phospholipid/cholesterol/gamma-HCH transport system ATP-binding protein